jgi:RNA polymerase sigma-70 factor (sigma-E family)
VQQHQREFAEFYAATRDDCLRVVLLTAGDRLLAEDLVAEAYTRAWLSWRKVRGLDQPRAWVVRTALNTRISWWRRRRREVGLDDQAYDHASPASQDGTYQRSLDTDLVAALRRLPVRQREVVALRLLLDLDTASTAEALGLADGTVGSHLHRALANLRRDLRPDRAGRPPRPGRAGLDLYPDRAGLYPRADLRLASRAADDQELTS